MFSVYCPTHDARVLLGTDHITAIVNTATGPVVEWRCTCGTTGSVAIRGGPSGEPARAA